MEKKTAIQDRAKSEDDGAEVESVKVLKHFCLVHNLPKSYSKVHCYVSVREDEKR